jgi:hypothetical protein
VVDRLSKGVSGIELGQIVAAMPISGAYAEFVCLKREGSGRTLKTAFALNPAVDWSYDK